MSCKSSFQALNALLKQSNIPMRNKETIYNLSDLGKATLEKYLNPCSLFHKYGDFKSNAKKSILNLSEDLSVYHYTTISSLKKIMAANYFRISSTDQMNDKDEFQWASKLAQKALRYLNATPDEIDVFNRQVQHRFYSTSYLWSFTQNPDSQPLFLEYGKGEGVAIELNAQNVMHALVHENGHGKESLLDYTNIEGYTTCLKVEYDLNVQNKHINSIIGEWLMALRCYKQDEDDMLQIMGTCLMNIELLNYFFKNPLLRHEEEVRFIVLQKETNSQNSHKENNKYCIHCPIHHQFINSIKVKTNNESTVEMVKSLVHGFDNYVKVTKSSLPY